MFFDVEKLSDRIIDALKNRRRYGGLRQNARQTILDRFDLKRICLPQMEAFLLDRSPAVGSRQPGAVTPARRATGLHKPVQRPRSAQAAPKKI